ncbi:MAG TPA: flagellar hook-length control protein FliK [Candidatus Eremiobacteraeota bacterium]|nr:MAG: Flagellar hook-length control protein FliK [bacterium ADurb.Bin363]HPZ09693.1 flagellar hook-length control protein FliK [Candidatus Eremiobacteraeota bacterium]
MINKEIGKKLDASFSSGGVSPQKESISEDYSFGDALAEKETDADKVEKKEMGQKEIERTETQEEVNKREYEKFMERQNLLFSSSNINNIAANQQMANNLPMQKHLNTMTPKNIAFTGNQIVNQGEVGLKDLQKLMAQRGISFNQLDSQQMGKIYTMHSRTEVTNFLNQLAKKMRYDDDKGTLSAGPQLFSDNKEVKGEKVKEIDKKQKLGDKKETEEIDGMAQSAEQSKNQGVSLSQFFEQAKLSEFKQGSPMEQQILKQVMDKMEINTEKAKSEVAIKLNPEYLGEVKLNMTVDKDKGTVSVNFKTGSKTAKKTLEGNIKGLEEAFAAAGLKLDKFEVSLDDELA